MRTFFYLLLLAITFSACTQQSFKKGDEGLEYKIISDEKGEKVKYGDFMQLHIAQYYQTGTKDSLLSDTRTGIPTFEMLDSIRTPMHYYKILSQLHKGDSLVIRVLTDTLYKSSAMPAFFKKGHKLVTTVKLFNLFASREQADSARQAEIVLAEKRLEEKDALTLPGDIKTLTDHFAKNNIKAVKAPKGTFVEIIQMGTGPNIDSNVAVKINYTGRVLNNPKPFDSNTDTAAQARREPLLANMTSDPTLGMTVIKGWNDGLLLLNKGAKAKLYIPSALGYGSRGNGQEIPANSILVFDIEVVDVLNREQAAVVAAQERQKMEAMQQMQQQIQQQMQAQQPQQGAPQPK